MQVGTIRLNMSSSFQRQLEPKSTWRIVGVAAVKEYQLNGPAGLFRDSGESRQALNRRRLLAGLSGRGGLGGNLVAAQTRGEPAQGHLPPRLPTPNLSGPRSDQGG